MRCEHLCTYCISSKFREDFKGMFVFKKLGSLDQKGPSLSFFQLMLAPPNTPWAFGCRPKQSQSFNQVPKVVQYPIKMEPATMLISFGFSSHPVDLRIKIWLVDWLLVPVQYSAGGWPWISVSNRPAYTTDFLFDIVVGFGATRRSKSRNNLSTKVMRSA